MFKNEKKGFYGSLSKIGRDAAIHAFLKLAGYNKSGSQKRPKKRPKKMDDDNLDYFKDNLVIVKTYHNSVKNINKQKKKSKTEITVKKDDKLYKFFHPQTEIEELKYINSPSCTKYTPKYNLIFPKLITGPKWKKLQGRTYKEIVIDEKDFLITHDSKLNSGNKFLVNMDKTTKRGDIFKCKDVQISCVKAFDNNNNKNKNKKKVNKKNKNKNKKNDSKEINILKRAKSIKNINNISKITTKIVQTLSYNDNDKVYLKKSKSLNINSKLNFKSYLNKKKTKNQTLKKKTFLNKTFLKNIENQSHKNENEISIILKNNTINFEKIISREKRNKLDAKPRYLDIARVINYSLVEERPKTFIFNKSKNNSNIRKKFKGIDPSLTFDTNKANNIRTIHSLKKVPNFNLILPRPGSKKNPLPSFMLKNFNREAIYSINDKTLELNRYSKGKLGKVDSSFFPKKSFNNVVNIQIMAGKDFEKESNIDDINRKKDNIKNTFKYKNVGKLIKEGALTKFDNITFKTIHKTKNFVNSDLNKYLLGLKI